MAEQLSRLARSGKVPAPAPQATPITVTPAKRRQRKETNRSLEWRKNSFCSLSISVKKIFSLRPAEGGELCTWAKILHREDYPRAIPLTLSPLLPQDTLLLRVDSKGIVDVTNDRAHLLDTKVVWKDKKPVTQKEDANSTEFICLRKDGEFVNIQVSVISRHEEFYLVVQEVFHGVFVTLPLVQDTIPHVVVDDRIIGVFPRRAENDYPNSNYFESFPAGKEAASLAIQKCILPRMVDILPIAPWAPRAHIELTDKMHKNGWTKAVVKFFNAQMGYGFVICNDGASCFVHFKTILGENGAPLVFDGQFPILNPMTEVLVKYKDGDRGRQATAVRV